MESKNKNLLIGIISLIITIISFIYTIIKDFPWYWVVITLQCALILVLFYFFRNAFSTNQKRRKKELNEAITKIKSTFTDQGLITDFLKNTILNEEVFYDLRKSIKHFELTKYEKSFKIIGNDIETKEKLIGSNISEQLQDRIRFIEYGGSVLRDENYYKKAFQIKGKVKHELTEKIVKVGERIKISDFIFAQPINPNAPFTVEYKDFWPGAMVAGEDAVFYTQTLYFQETIRKIESTIEFDVLVSSIRAYYYDFKSRSCTICNPPRKMQNDYTYKWVVNNPQNHRLYYIVFTRQ